VYQCAFSILDSNLPFAKDLHLYDRVNSSIRDGQSSILSARGAYTVAIYFSTIRNYIYNYYAEFLLIASWTRMSSEIIILERIECGCFKPSAPKCAPPADFPFWAACRASKIFNRKNPARLHTRGNLPRKMHGIQPTTPGVLPVSSF